MNRRTKNSGKRNAPSGSHGVLSRRLNSEKVKTCPDRFGTPSAEQHPDRARDGGKPLEYIITNVCVYLVAVGILSQRCRSPQAQQPVPVLVHVGVEPAPLRNHAFFPRSLPARTAWLHPLVYEPYSYTCMGILVRPVRAVARGQLEELVPDVHEV